MSAPEKREMSTIHATILPLPSVAKLRIGVATPELVLVMVSTPSEKLNEVTSRIGTPVTVGPKNPVEKFPVFGATGEEVVKNPEIDSLVVNGPATLVNGLPV